MYSHDFLIVYLNFPMIKKHSFGIKTEISILTILLKENTLQLSPVDAIELYIYYLSN